MITELGRLEYFLGTGRERRLKQVRYYAVSSDSPLLADLPRGTRERRWLRRWELSSAPLVSEDLRGLLQAALDREPRMAELETNRDLYCFIADLVRRRAESGTTLQAYLENLRRLACRMGDRDALPLSDFAELLQAAFEPELQRIEPCASATDAYLAWEQRITEQIRDLSEMKEAGALDNEYRYFGVDAPRGGRWYNFDPCSYLECAAAGSFGGWQEGDDTGRSYVPGPVAVLDASGAVTSMAPSDIDAPVVELPEITWEAFIDFLNAGQWYE